jgi:hypothetical protein
MASFQNLTLIIAGVLLLICIVLIVIIMVFPNTKQVWPPMIANCPDYFTDVNGDGSKCLNINNVQNSPSSNCQMIPDFTQSTYKGITGNCNKYNWANRCSLTWDGITYGVTNPCTTYNKK